MAASGSYQIAVRLSGVNVGGSPYAITIAAGALDPASSFVSPTAATEASTTAGVRGSFLFTAADGQGNPLTTGGAQIQVYTLLQVRLQTHDATNQPPRRFFSRICLGLWRMQKID